ncbi:MAG: hypothetical protein M4D80_33000 [Myxococcota bacterium]|nr:hypothetical protein [Deltaproteobacteria bacterium]MDQ3340004.1 hypothetical protein [Myxococcota bacterium]
MKTKPTRKTTSKSTRKTSSKSTSKSTRKTSSKPARKTSSKPARKTSSKSPRKTSSKSPRKPAVKVSGGAKRLRAAPWGRQPAVRAHWAATAAVHDEMTASLAVGRGDEGKERAAFAQAIECYMGIENTPEDPREAMCAEFLWEGGNGGVPGVIERAVEVDGETHDRWFRLLIEEEGAFRRRRGLA